MKRIWKKENPVGRIYRGTILVIWVFVSETINVCNLWNLPRSEQSNWEKDNYEGAMMQTPLSAAQTEPRIVCIPSSQKGETSFITLSIKEKFPVL